MRPLTQVEQTRAIELLRCVLIDSSMENEFDSDIRLFLEEANLMPDEPLDKKLEDYDKESSYWRSDWGGPNGVGGS